MHFLWHDIQHGLLHFDKGIFYTTRQLFTRPGYAINEFIEGKRVKHFKPFSLIIVLATVYGFLFHYFDISEKIAKFAPQNANTAKLISTQKVFDWVGTHYAFTTLLMLPLVSLASYWAFKSYKKNYVEHLVLNSFVSAQHIVVHIVLFPFYFTANSSLSFGLLSAILTLFEVILTTWTYFQFFNQLTLSQKVWKTILAYILQLILYVGLIVIVVLGAGIYITATHKQH